MENGNVLITIGGDQRVIELKPDGTLVWEYVLASAFFTFRAVKYPIDYSAFDGRDLTPKGTIENPPSSVTCSPVSSIDKTALKPFKSWANTNLSTIYFQAPFESDFTIEIVNVLGQRLNYFNSKSGITEVDTTLTKITILKSGLSWVFYDLSHICLAAHG